MIHQERHDGGRTTEQALREAAAVLLASGIERGRVEAEILLAHVLRARRLDLVAFSERVLTDQEAEAFGRLIARRASRYPLPYLTGEREFMGLTFHVNEHVLIPRPETEVMVEAAVEVLRALVDQGPGTNDQGPGTRDQGPGTRDHRPGSAENEHEDEGRVGNLPISSISSFPPCPRPTLQHSITPPLQHSSAPPGPLVVDVGTGSGCIAISLARFVPEARVLATDISPEACAVARLNACRLGVAERVAVYEGDLLAPLEEVSGAVLPPALRAAIVCANLPYIPEEHLKDLQPEVRDWEPAVALGGGPGGLEVVERFLAQVGGHLRPGGTLFLEIGPEADQAPRLAAALAERGCWCNVRVLRDLAGLPRVVAAVYAG